MNEADRNSPQTAPNIQEIALVLSSEIRQLIGAAKQRAAFAINSEITFLY